MAKTLIQMKIKANDHDALNAAFAEKVAAFKIEDGYFVLHRAPEEPTTWATLELLSYWKTKVPPGFTRSADAVLPWLEKCAFFEAEIRITGSVSRNFFVSLTANEPGFGLASTFPHAAVIALLRAHGVQVED